MAKSKTSYVCSSCGYTTSRWYGKCPQCENWNTLEEKQAEEEAAPKKIKRAPSAGADVFSVGDIPDDSIERRFSGIGELDRVLGGGIVEGSIVLVGGDPGIGKSTLLTQVSGNLAGAGERVIYASGEESARQIKMRANRLGIAHTGFLVISENDLDAILNKCESLGPGFMIVDSIQTMYLPEVGSAPGSVTQVRECASALMRYAKRTGCAVILVGHVTKDGALAGPRILEHMVDAVLYFEGDRQHQYRMLRAVKNRFGSVNELGMFEMTGNGMREVKNVSETLIAGRMPNSTGSVVMCTMEGSRPMLTDVQALVATTVFGNPRRMASGVDQGRLALLMAVIEKRAGFRMYDQDVYLNIAGGMTLTEPAADLAILISVASSLRNKPVPEDMAVAGEIGLAGEVRAISNAQRRVSECERLGFKKLILPKTNLRGITAGPGVELIGVSTVSEAIAAALRL